MKPKSFKPQAAAISGRPLKSATQRASKVKNQPAAATADGDTIDRGNFDMNMMTAIVPPATATAIPSRAQWDEKVAAWRDFWHQSSVHPAGDMLTDAEGYADAKREWDEIVGRAFLAASRVARTPAPDAAALIEKLDMLQETEGLNQDFADFVFDVLKADVARLAHQPSDRKDAGVGARSPAREREGVGDRATRDELKACLQAAMRAHDDAIYKVDDAAYQLDVLESALETLIDRLGLDTWLKRKFHACWREAMYAFEKLEEGRDAMIGANETVTRCAWEALAAADAAAVLDKVE